MATAVIILNGGSSAGKSTVARYLQEVLHDPWLSFSVDALIAAMPPVMFATSDGIAFGTDGAVSPGPMFHRVESAWMQGIAAMARAGARIVIDDVFLGGAAGQERWEEALRGLDVLWVGVHCTAQIATAREAARTDRIPGMAQQQAAAVHKGVRYDVDVDTSTRDAASCAREIAVHVTA